ncbi:leucine-rich repeat domain-containing protein [Paenibacillus eucommiae]|uniref:DNA-directed RNA polymerase subunit RPC12/RpoP n=1 Tax=Paenibacillus eucommiae TaxID=1355755 RepID=A0ABS4ITE6_9BACL|nr:leucine-rich repeat domain-containing protein [Paenibacillus eucommiae]MBP1990844.1 DNA-directed RNA polymerase subunit RPC12/RpoP [Paenibacillus eucommiae]
MGLIKLNCPNCNGKIEHKDEKTFKCPYCGTELLLNENKVYYVDQTINNYYGAAPAARKTPTQTKAGTLLLTFVILAFAAVGYFYLTNNQQQKGIVSKVEIRTMPESEVVLFFLRDIFNKGEVMPTEEELASIRYLSVGYEDNQWRFTYSFDDPFNTKQAKMHDYVVMDKILNTKRLEQKDFEAFSGLTALDLRNTYEILKNEKVTFQHMQGLKSYSGGFNESFSQFAEYFADKDKIEELILQIRSDDELAVVLQFPNLKNLEITYIGESVTDFKLLGQLNLQSLGLRGCNDLQWLSVLTNLKSLKLQYSEATDFTSFYSLNQLQELDLKFVKNLKTMDFIQNMPQLQVLKMDFAEISNLNILKDKASLTKLYLTLSSLDSLDFVNSLTSLTELSISSYYGSVPTLTLPNLRKAELPGAFVQKLTAPALMSLSADISGMTLSGEKIVEFPQLEELSIEESGQLSEIRALNKVPSLKNLSIHDIYIDNEIDALFSLSHVTNLTCKECRIDLNKVTPFENDVLEHLALEKVTFKLGDDFSKEVEKVMPYFSNMSALRTFTMQDSMLQSLQFMKKWQQIEELHLENNAIVDIEPLVGMPKLKKLFILGNQVHNKTVLDKGVSVY